MHLTIEQELELAQSDGVSHVENRPFLLHPENPNQKGVLLVHGFSSTPREMRALGERLCRNGYIVMGVRLPGHGTSPEDLRHRKIAEWLQTAERGHQILQPLCQKISAVGISTGSLILLQLALRYPLEKLALLSPYLQLRHPLAPLAGVLRHFKSYHHRELQLEDRQFFYERRPLKSIAQLNRLMRDVKKQLVRVQTPTLVLSSRGDHTIVPESAQRLFDQLGSRHKEIHWYGDDVPHGMTSPNNPQQADVFARVVKFLQTPLDAMSPSDQIVQPTQDQ